jgi:hypothetical protein
MDPLFTRMYESDAKGAQNNAARSDDQRSGEDQRAARRVTGTVAILLRATGDN